VPSDVAIAVSNHVAAPASDLETRYFRLVNDGRAWLTIG
jgi:hypothetical protein